jgi:hypothetical protein
MILHTEYHMRTNGTSLCVSAIEILFRLIMSFHVTIEYGCFEFSWCWQLQIKKENKFNFTEVIVSALKSLIQIK